MNKRYTIIFLISVKIFSQDSPFDKKSNNMTLDGNLEASTPRPPPTSTPSASWC